MLVPWPKKVNAVYLAINVLLAGFLLGCSNTIQGNFVPKSSASSNALSRLQGAPIQIPNLWANGVKVEPAGYEWVVDGKWVKFRTSSDPDKAKLPTIEAGIGGLHFLLGSAITPTQLYVSLFSDLDERGIPLSDIGDEINCLDSMRCSMSKNGETLSFEVSDIGRTKIAVVHLGYLRSAPNRTTIESPPVVLVIGSWGMRIKHKK